MLDPDRLRAASVRFPCTRAAAKLPLPKHFFFTIAPNDAHVLHLIRQERSG
jgi:hypothetical protein